MPRTTHTNWPPAHIRAHRATDRRTRLAGVLLGVLAVALGGPTAATEPAATGPDAATWAGWLERHREIEHAVGTTVATGPGSDAWSRHLALEYPA